MSQAKHFDEIEHISYANVSSGKSTMPAEQQSSQEQYQALSVRAWDSAAANISLTWPCTEPCVFSITSRCAAFMDCWDCVLKWTQQCTGRIASLAICPNKYAEWRATSVAAWAESFPGNDILPRASDQTSGEKQGLCTYREDMSVHNMTMNHTTFIHILISCFYPHKWIGCRDFNVCQSATLFHIEISKQVFNGLTWNFVTSWYSEVEFYWLWWSTDFSSSATMRFTFVVLLPLLHCNSQQLLDCHLIWYILCIDRPLRMNGNTFVDPLLFPLVLSSRQFFYVHNSLVHEPKTCKTKISISPWCISASVCMAGC